MYSVQYTCSTLRMAVIKQIIAYTIIIIIHVYIAIVLYMYSNVYGASDPCIN